MRLIAVHNVQTFDGEYAVELFDISVSVSVYKKRKTGTVYQQRLAHGSQRFKAAIKALVQSSAPGSLAREQLAECDCTVVRNALART